MNDNCEYNCVFSYLRFIYLIFHQVFILIMYNYVFTYFTIFNFFYSLVFYLLKADNRISVSLAHYLSEADKPISILRKTT